MDTETTMPEEVTPSTPEIAPETEAHTEETMVPPMGEPTEPEEAPAEAAA